MPREWSPEDERGLQEALEANQPWDAYERKLKEDALDPEVEELRENRARRIAEWQAELRNNTDNKR